MHATIVALFRIEVKVVRHISAFKTVENLRSEIGADQLGSMELKGWGLTLTPERSPSIIGHHRRLE